MPKKDKAIKKSITNKVVSKADVAFPGYVEFTKQTLYVVKQSKLTFLRLITLLTLLVLVLVASTQHAVYIEQASSISTISSEVSGGLVSKIIETGILYSTILTGTFNAALSESQQILLGIVYLFTWLIVIWILRHALLNKNVSLRDSIYSAGAPTVSTLLIIVIAGLQLLPLAIVTALISAIASSGVISTPLVILGALLVIALSVLTLYWLVGTLFAAIIVTIPGTYPVAALKSARQIIRGKRALLLRRVLWLGLINLLVFGIILIPVLFLDVLSGYALSLLTISISTVLSLSLFIFSTSYLYLLYRRIIDEPST